MICVYGMTDCVINKCRTRLRSDSITEWLSFSSKFQFACQRKLESAPAGSDVGNVFLSFNEIARALTCLSTTNTSDEEAG